jgi:hypothetical protein
MNDVTACNVQDFTFKQRYKIITYRRTTFNKTVLKRTSNSQRPRLRDDHFFVFFGASPGRIMSTGKKKLPQIYILSMV